MIRRPLRAAACALVLVGLGPLVTGCQGDVSGTATSAPTPAAEETSAAAELRPGMDVPPPTGRVVLTIRGSDVTNVGDELRLDLAQLESMGTTTLEADDTEATGRRTSFSGPLVRTVLDVAGADQATNLHVVALNDYEVDVPVSDARDLPLMLATRADGQPMSVANYGPTRFVYPTEGYDLPRSTYAPRWIWQLKEIWVE